MTENDRNVEQAIDGLALLLTETESNSNQPPSFKLRMRIAHCLHCLKVVHDASVNRPIKEAVGHAYIHLEKLLPLRGDCPLFLSGIARRRFEHALLKLEDAHVADITTLAAAADPFSSHQGEMPSTNFDYTMRHKDIIKEVQNALDTADLSDGKIKGMIRGATERGELSKRYVEGKSMYHEGKIFKWLNDLRTDFMNEND